MVARKEKQFIIFTLDDGKEVKYDLSTGKTYGKTGKEVKSITTQLRGYNITDLIDSFPEENYRNFLNFLNSQFVNRIKDRYGWQNDYTVGNKVSNIGTFLKKINNYRFFEQYFSAGITDIDRSFCIPMNQLPKKYLAYVRKTKEKITTENVKRYEAFANEFGEIERIQDNYELLKRKDLISMFVPATRLAYNSETGKNDKLVIVGEGAYTRNRNQERFQILINTYNYNKMSLLQYIDNIMYYEGVEPYSKILEELVDYNKMQSEMSIHKYEKYPKNFLTTHTITCRNYNRLTKEYPVENFMERIDKEMEFKYKDYIFIYPNTPQDIKDEAVMQTNCVASYIDKVMNGVCHIMFLRHKDAPDKALVTLEIRNNQVIQKRRAFNLDPSIEEEEAIVQFNKHLFKLQKRRLTQKQKEDQFLQATYIAPQRMVKRAV